MRNNGKARERSETRGSIKIVVDAHSDEAPRRRRARLGRGGARSHLRPADERRRSGLGPARCRSDPPDAFRGRAGRCRDADLSSRATRPVADDDLDRLQRNAFSYFLHETDVATGLVRDSTHDGSPASIAAVGFALTAYPWPPRAASWSATEAAARDAHDASLLQQRPQGEQPDASGYHGFFYHFLDMGSGRRAWDCEALDHRYRLSDGGRSDLRGVLRRPGS